MKLWHAILFSGPLFIFLSSLGLRDLQIVLCVSYFYLGQVPLLRFVALGVSALLRPHLTVALIFGWLVGQLLKRHPLKRAPLALIAITVAAFVAGGFGFALGGFFKYQNSYVSPKLFTQQAWWRFFANLLGLQFLTFGKDVVRLTPIVKPMKPLPISPRKIVAGGQLKYKKPTTAPHKSAGTCHNSVLEMLNKKMHDRHHK